MGDPIRTVLDGDVTIEHRGDYLHVYHARSARDLAELDEVIKALEAALAETGVTLILFDSRDSDTTPDDVGARLWEWLHEGPVSRVATLIKSEMLQISVQLKGLAQNVRLRAFDDEQEALEWLRRMQNLVV